MPEGHTIHAIAGRLDAAFGGTTPQVSTLQARFAESVALLNGRELLDARAVGKHLFVTFAGEAILHVHLGLIGSWIVYPGGPDAHPAVGELRCRIASETAVADLRGPTHCAVETPEVVERTLARLGPDPLALDADLVADTARSFTKIGRSGKSIAELLMDQSVVAGVGNVYRCEVLFRHRVNPFTAGRDLKKKTWSLLYADLARLLPLGLVYNQILTMEDQVVEAETQIAAGQHGDIQTAITGTRMGETFERRFSVYKRTGEPCRVCGSKVKSMLVAGRTLYWCGRCQRRG